MSGVTTAQLQDRIITEVGDTPTGLLAAHLPTIWASYADKAQIAPHLQRLYAKRAAIDLVIGSSRTLVNRAASGISKHDHQQIDTLMAMRKVADADIVELEKQIRGRRGAALVPLTHVAIETPPQPGDPLAPLDANDPRYAGDPYRRTFRTGGW